MKYSYNPTGVCASRMEFDIENNISLELNSLMNSVKDNDLTKMKSIINELNILIIFININKV